MEHKKKRFDIANIQKCLRKRKLLRLKSKVKYETMIADLKVKMHKQSHSLLWVWEFSKKAVLICFIFYVIVQFYAMIVMLYFYDFTYLGDLINQTGQILQNCVFAYLIKAGIENVGKILFHDDSDEHEDGSVG